MKTFLFISLLFMANLIVAQESTEPKITDELTNEGYLIQASTFLLIEEYSKAEELAKKVFITEAQNATANYLLSKIYLGKNNPEEALIFARKAFSENNNKEIKHHLASTLLSNFRYQEAIELLEDLKYGPQSYLALANAYSAASEPQKTLKVIEEYQDLFGEGKDITALKIKTLKQLKSVKKVVQAYVDRLAIEPALLAELKDYSKQENALKITSELIQNSNLENKEELLASLGPNEEETVVASLSLEQALQLTKEDPNTLENWVQLLELSSDKVNVAEEALMYFPSQYRLWMYYGNALEENKNYKKAIEAYAEVQNLAFDLPNIQKLVEERIANCKQFK